MNPPIKSDKSTQESNITKTKFSEYTQIHQKDTQIITQKTYQ